MSPERLALLRAFVECGSIPADELGLLAELLMEHDRLRYEYNRLVLAEFGAVSLLCEHLKVDARAVRETALSRAKSQLPGWPRS